MQEHGLIARDIGLCMGDSPNGTKEKRFNGFPNKILPARSASKGRTYPCWRCGLASKDFV